MRNPEMFCFNCMAELSRPGDMCPRCGWNNAYRGNEPGHLPAWVLKGQYIVGRSLGRGGFGVTYLGYDLNLNRRVAIKEYFPLALALRASDGVTIIPYADCREQFEWGRRRALDEGGLTARLSQVPGIMQVYNSFEENGTVYIVMEYITGTTLTKLVRERGPMTWAEAYSLMRPIMRALESIHRQGVIHRDVSPDNVMLRVDIAQTVLLDFGAARSYADEKLGMTQTVRPGYAPPEQYSSMSKQDGRSDEYALCATLYFLLTGKTPPAADQRVYAGTQPTPPSALGASLTRAAEEALLKGMSTRMEDRYPSMADLRAVLDRQPMHAAPRQQSRQKQTPPPKRTPPPKKAAPAKQAAPAKRAPAAKKRKPDVLTGVLVTALIAAVAFVAAMVCIWVVPGAPDNTVARPVLAANPSQTDESTVSTPPPTYKPILPPMTSATDPPMPTPDVTDAPSAVVGTYSLRRGEQVYEEPSPDALVCGSMNCTRDVDVLSTTGGYARIEYFDTGQDQVIQGYVRSDRLGPSKSGTLYYPVCTDFVSLRSKPSSSSKSLTEIPLGNSLRYLDSGQNGFAHVSYGGQEGYAHVRYLESEADLIAHPGDTVRIANCEEWVSLRETPYYDAGVLAQLDIGTAVTYLGRVSVWFSCVEYDGMVGYVDSSYLK